MIISDLWLLVGMLLMFVAGIMFALGPLHAVRIRLARRRNRRLAAKLSRPKQPAPITTVVPYMQLLNGGESWRRLDLPTVTRRGRN